VRSNDLLTFKSGSENCKIDLPNLSIEAVTFDNKIDKIRNQFIGNIRPENYGLVNPNMPKVGVSELMDSFSYLGLQDNYFWRANKNFSVSVYDKDVLTPMTVTDLYKMFEPGDKMNNHTSISGCLNKNIAIEIDTTTNNLKTLGYNNTWYKMGMSSFGVCMNAENATRQYLDMSLEFYDTTNATWKTVFSSDTYRQTWVQPPAKTQSNPTELAEMYFNYGFRRYLTAHRLRVVFMNCPIDILNITYIYAKNVYWMGHFMGLDGGNTWGDVSFLDSAKGVLLKDRTTGTYKRLVVNDGVLSVENV